MTKKKTGPASTIGKVAMSRGVGQPVVHRAPNKIRSGYVRPYMILKTAKRTSRAR